MYWVLLGLVHEFYVFHMTSMTSPTAWATSSQSQALFDPSQLSRWFLPGFLRATGAWRASGDVKMLKLNQLPGIKVETTGATAAVFFVLMIFFKKVVTGREFCLELFFLGCVGCVRRMV